jgi:hypothetical protein
MDTIMFNGNILSELLFVAIKKFEFEVGPNTFEIKCFEEDIF